MGGLHGVRQGGDLTKPFELTLRLRHNILKRFRTRMGMSSRSMAEAIGISYPLYINCENLKWSPIGQDAGETRWKPSALKIAEFLGMSPEDVWPPEILEVATPVVVREMAARDLRPLLASQARGISMGILEAPSEMLDRKQLAQKVRRMLEELPPLHRNVLVQRAIEKDQFKDIGSRFGFSWQRAQQVYWEAVEIVRDKCLLDQGMRDLMGLEEKGS